MKIGKIVHFGTWDSKKDRINKNGHTEYRDVSMFEIELIISGNGILFIDDEEYRTIPNLLVIAKPGSVRKSIFDFKTYFIHMEIDDSFEYRDILYNLPDFTYTTVPEVYMQIFTDIRNHLIDNNADTDTLYFKSKFLELIFMLDEDAKKNTHLLKNGDFYKVNKLIKKITGYIDKNYAEKITLEDLSRATNYSANYLQHIFSSVTGMSPNEYLTGERIKNAKQLLIDSNKSIADVAYECGFSSQAYFTKIFKEKILCTPKEYRRMVFEKALYPHE